jgi:hypothetical protein
VGRRKKTDITFPEETAICMARKHGPFRGETVENRKVL